MFYISKEKKDIQLEAVKNLLAQSYWANKRSTETIQKSIENSECFGAYLDDSHKQVGFARVVTDYATTYYICDVIVDEAYRGHGIGKALVEAITTDERFTSLPGMLLTADAHKLYEQFGFKKDTLRYMGKRLS